MTNETDNLLVKSSLYCAPDENKQVVHRRQECKHGRTEDRCDDCNEVEELKEQIVDLKAKLKEARNEMSKQPDQDYEAQGTEVIAEALDKMSVEELEEAGRSAIPPWYEPPWYAELHKQIDDLKAKLAEYVEIDKEVKDAIDDRESMLEQLEKCKALLPELDFEKYEYESEEIDIEFVTCSDPRFESKGIHLIRTPKQPEPSEYLSTEEITDEIAKLRPKCEFLTNTGVPFRSTLVAVYGSLCASHDLGIWPIVDCRVLRADVEAKEAE